MTPPQAGPVARRRRRSVTILRWPEQETERRRLADRGEPRVLLLAEGERPPAPVDDQERCLASESGPQALVDALASLQDDAPGEPAEPRLDEDGLLWSDGRWVAISETQLPIVRVILAHQGRVVRTSELLAAYRTAGGSTSSSSLKSVVYRVGRRFAAVGLDLLVVRNRGVILRRGSG